MLKDQGPEGHNCQQDLVTSEEEVATADTGPTPTAGPLQLSQADRCPGDGPCVPLRTARTRVGCTCTACSLLWANILEEQLGTGARGPSVSSDL